MHYEFVNFIWEFDCVMKVEGIPDCCLYIYKILYMYIMQDEMHGWAVLM